MGILAQILDGESTITRNRPLPLRWGSSTNRRGSSTRAEGGGANISATRHARRSGTVLPARFVGPDADAQWRAFDLDRPSGESVVYPSFKGATIPFVPLTVCNVERLGIAEWSRPPYLDLARLAVENYVVDSWYKMGLYFHATPTLAVCNATRESKNVRLGGVVWPRSAGAVPVTVSILETSGAGLAELRNAKSELRDTLRYTSIRDLVERSGANSSSESLRIRTTTGSASIAAIDRTGARAIEEQLCFASLWSGASLDETRRRIAYTADVSYPRRRVGSIRSSNFSGRTARRTRFRTAARTRFWRRPRPGAALLR